MGLVKKGKADVLYQKVLSIRFLFYRAIVKRKKIRLKLTLSIFSRNLVTHL